MKIPSNCFSILIGPEPCARFTSVNANTIYTLWPYTTPGSSCVRWMPSASMPPLRHTLHGRPRNVPLTKLRFLPRPLFGPRPTHKKSLRRALCCLVSWLFVPIYIAPARSSVDWLMDTAHKHSASAGVPLCCQSRTSGRANAGSRKRSRDEE